MFKSKIAVMLVLAIVCGGLSLVVARSLFERRSAPAAPVVVAGPEVPMRTVVVARLPMAFGTEIDRTLVQEVRWPEAAIPPGSFSSVEEMLAPGRRAVLSPFAVNEPILAVKITGPGQRATLSALVEEGRRAVTIRVNDVLGVGGFVAAGDRVDVLLTRTEGQAQGTTDVILQGVRVLAVDQLADDRTDRPSAQVRSVTIEVSIQDAQRVQLASVAGTLSLILRRSGEADAGSTRRITLDDVLGQTPVQPASAPPAPAAAPSQNFSLSSAFERRPPTQGTVTVMRPKDRQEYTVPLEQAR